ncbi:MAG: TetM/TetW/TetO/TetS family tetracycline resistance ribosomal protection protein, partial [Ruminococcus sp.]|nr:TetM/TetW/TetO/TetS family tetracycline resistance ribosomal protection protein [Ruminococcus sp.]
DGSWVEEKASRIRIYSGGRATELQQADAGDVIAVPGLTATYAGMVIGGSGETDTAARNAAVCCAVYPPEGCDSFTLLSKLLELQEEDPALQVHFNEKTQETELTLSGELQTEVLRHEIKRRYGLDVTFGSGRVLYKETIAAPVEGVGHFEPLRHYAEVHLVLTPLPEGSGIIYDSAVPEDRLDRSWQNLIISSLKAKEHVGVLTGSPVTDMRVTLTAGRAHPKHTEGGDFREAAWRALRQGLMKGQSILLEPFYSFSLRVPAAQVGKALADLDRMNAEFSQPEPDGDMQLISGRAPAVSLKSYAAEVAAYTHGSGSLYTEPAGYSPCLNDKEVIAAAGYDPCADLENTPDSVFCSHGSGDVVSWQEVEQHMHLPATLTEDKPVPVSAERSRRYSLSDDELRGIMQKLAPERKQSEDDEKESRCSREAAKRAAAKSMKPDTRPRLLLVDGYNVIFAWESLRSLAGVNIDSACAKLADILSNYAGFKGVAVMLVFDAYKTPAVTPHKVTADSIEVVYTRSGQTSDAFIESFCSENRKKLRIKVASSDGMVQMSVMRCGALRMSSRELELEVAAAERRIKEIIN